MFLRILSYTTLLTFGLFLSDCHEAYVLPGDYNYPISLDLIPGSTSMRLKWTPVSISSFQEYVVFRSHDSIPDMSADELLGKFEVISRIEHYDSTNLVDPIITIDSDIFYKVIAIIGNRALHSPTLSASQAYQAIDHRTDVMTIDTASNEIAVAVRFAGQLFIYNYSDKEISAARNFPIPNDPKLQFGSYNEVNELYLAHRVSRKLYIFSRSDLTLLKEFESDDPITDFTYLQGYFIITLSSGNTEIRSREDFELVADWHAPPVNKALFALEDDTQSFKYLEYSFAYISVYELQGNNIERLAVRTGISNIDVKTLSIHPESIEMIVNTTGKVIDNQLDDAGYLGNAALTHTLVTYIQNGTRVAAMHVLSNSSELSFYERSDLYKQISRKRTSLVPHRIWEDNNQLYSITHITSPTGLKSVIHTYQLPEQ